MAKFWVGLGVTTAPNLATKGQWLDKGLITGFGVNNVWILQNFDPLVLFFYASLMVVYFSPSSKLNLSLP